ncbi:peptidoglycan-binding protein [Sporosarcina sp. FSL K6-1522]|uniref:peptidoglycan-binding protein n=1 Tax=Sporosarcina sp. FSL K6-1522 TaxID=2921554 RepID=UPI003159FC6D
MSVTTSNRDINALHPVAQQACRLFLQECEKAGVKIFITETYRSQERQNYLYAQGRTRPGKIVTWTLNSNHKSKLAWDIAVIPPANLYDVVTLNRAGAIARKLGITWGGDWKYNIDRPHFEVKSSWRAPANDTVKELQRLLNKIGYKLDVDGLYGPATTNAVKDFQKVNDLTVDGSAGSATMAALEKATKPSPPTVAVDTPKEVDEMAQQLPDTQKKDMKNLLEHAYNTRGKDGKPIFSVNHAPKVDTMTRGQATDLLISYVARTAK